MKKIANDKGITLVALVITVIVLLILASISIPAGRDVIANTKLTTFGTEMQIMQTEVNKLQQKYKNGDTSVLEIGKDLQGNEEETNAFNGAIETETEGYRYYDKITLKELGLNDFSQEFLVNIPKRMIISLAGFNYKGQYIWTMAQLSNGSYNVKFEGINSETTFDLDKICDKLKIERSDLLVAFNNLLSNNLIVLISEKTDLGKRVDKVSLEGFYEKIQETRKKEKNNKLKEDIFSTFEKEFRRPLNGTEFEVIKAWLDKMYNEDLILLALKEAVYNGATNIRYIDTIKRNFNSLIIVNFQPIRNFTIIILHCLIVSTNFIENNCWFILIHCQQNSCIILSSKYSRNIFINCITILILTNVNFCVYCKG